MLRSSLIGLVSGLALITSANAADMYAPAPAGGYKDTFVPGPTWAGLYFGVNGGYGWSANGNRDLDIGIPGYGCCLAVGKTAEPQGGFGGAQVGYNWQFGHFVLGGETDIQISGISDTRNSSIFGPGFVSSDRVDLDWFGTVRGRLGYAWDNVLIYGTGGFAYGKVNELQTGTIFIPGPFELGHVSKNALETGWVAGGGVEYRPSWGFFSGNWTIKAEYQFINLEGEKATGNVLGFIPIETKARDDEFHTVRIGLNYHIPAGFEPLK